MWQKRYILRPSLCTTFWVGIIHSNELRKLTLSVIETGTLDVYGTNQKSKAQLGNYKNNNSVWVELAMFE